ncbi:hypothetical protein [Roseibium sediminicola]|uniref:Uncharacterized protein n=1 Tax=Roseibium sediminicola TaxID=2933272 RepID=A0ABT0GVR0_9HYPH|nr:hypothetical protein [Roseibium sp. CAU 1639]MCK7613532.1 hypothetical protein [Roseibium sp. CAU 1639]
MQIGSMPMMPPGGSPRDQVVNNLSAQVEAGEITAEDQDAMMEALDAMHAERMENGPPAPGSAPPSQEEIQANFESMLAEQVEAGTLGQDQADHLAEMFEEGELGRPPEGQGPPPPGGEGGGSMDELMSAILSQLQSGSTYDGSGEQTGSIASLLADYTA